MSVSGVLAYQSVIIRANLPLLGGSGMWSVGDLELNDSDVAAMGALIVAVPVEFHFGVVRCDDFFNSRF